MTCTIKIKKIWAVLIAIALMLSVFGICAFAADEGNEGDGLTTLTGTSSADTGTETVTETETTVDSTSETTAASETTATSSETTTTAAETTTEPSSWAERHSSFLIAMGVIAGCVIIYFVLKLLIPKFRAKTDKFWKDYNAEFRKLVWPTKQQLWRNSAVVLVTIAVFGIVLALLDYGLTKGVYALKDLVDLIRPAS